MDFLLLFVFFGAVGIGGAVLAYQTMQAAACAEIEAWAKQKGCRLIDIKPGSALLFLMGSISLDIAYETASGAREKADATYSRAFGGLVRELIVTPKSAFDYDRYG